MVEKIDIQIGLEGGNQVEKQFNAIGDAIRRVASTVTELGAAFAGVGLAVATAALIKFSKAATETEEALRELQKTSGDSFDNLSRLATVFRQGGSTVTEFAKAFGKLTEKVAAAGQQRDIRNADKEWVQWQNDIEQVSRKFDDLANGWKVSFSPLTTLDTQVKALLESLSSAGTAEQQWRKLADIFHNLSSDAQRVQLGTALGLSPAQIQTLTMGSQALQQMASDAQALGVTLTSSNQQALQQMAEAWSRFSGLVSAVFEKLAAIAAPVWTAIVQAADGALRGILTDFQNLPLDQALANLGPKIAVALEQIMATLSPIIIRAGTEIGVAIVNAIYEGFKSAVGSIFANMGAELEANLNILAENFRRLLMKFGLPGGAPIVAQERAAGGLIGGRGTGTSDSNLAWLSRGEYVMTARATQQPGVFSFLEALRRSGGNLSRVLDGMGRFALGGLVRGPIPAFAAGGPVSGMSHVTIQFPGVPTVSGLRASSAVVEQLQKAAALSQVRSGGRKPSRYT